VREYAAVALRFHHCRSIEHSCFGVVEPVLLTEVLEPPDCRGAGRCGDDEWHDALDYEPADEWVADRVGFWPLFLAVGETHDALLVVYWQTSTEPTNMQHGDIWIAYP
jgi:hypothetical protein